MKGDRMIRDWMEGGRIIGDRMEGDKMVQYKMEGEMMIWNRMIGDRMEWDRTDGDGIIGNRGQDGMGWDKSGHGDRIKGEGGKRICGYGTQWKGQDGRDMLEGTEWKGQGKGKGWKGIG